MRVGEAIALNVDDVDLDEGLAVVRGAKFNKSRELILHPSTTQALASYQQLRKRCWPRPPTTAFFVSTIGTRLHDLRHSFAMRTVTGWYRAGLEGGARLPLLSTYLGHAKPADTYWYLTATPELLALAAKRLETSAEVPT